MSDTVKFEITIRKTYEVDLADLYRDYRTLDIEEALAIDVNQMDADPGAFLGDNDDEYEVTGRVIS